jgi:hypothetical protein
MNQHVIQDRSTVALQQPSSLGGAGRTVARWVRSSRGDQVARTADWLGIGWSPGSCSRRARWRAGSAGAGPTWSASPRDRARRRPGPAALARPIGAIMNKGLTVRTAQQHGQKYVPRLLEHASRGGDDALRREHRVPRALAAPLL